MKNAPALFAIGSLIAVCNQLPAAQAAGGYQAYYQEALKAAQNKASRVRALGQPGALSSAAIKQVLGRYYEVGDEWQVASWVIEHPISRPNGPTSANPEPGYAAAGIFNYRVTRVHTGANPTVSIEITQVSAPGFEIADPRVDSLTLVMNDQTVQSEKTYRFKTALGSTAVRVSPDGLRSQITPLEFYALDVPEISTATRLAPVTMPSLPGPVGQVASRFNVKPNLAECSWFEQDDFFGRPVQLLWQHGDPWPTYLKTPTGISILIRKGAT